MKLTRERAARPSPPAPREANGQAGIGVGTAGWAAARGVLLIVRDSLPAAQRWWTWPRGCGVGAGLFASWSGRGRKRGRARAAARRGVRGEGPGGTGGGSPPCTEEVGREQAEGDQSAPRDSGSNTV